MRFALSIVLLSVCLVGDLIEKHSDQVWMVTLVFALNLASLFLAYQAFVSESYRGVARRLKARQHVKFEELEALLGAEDTAPLYKYLQCVHGSQHHSFVFFGGEFVGDGFALQADRMSDATFTAGLDRAGARRMCRRAGDQSLLGAPLQSCTQSSDGTTTGWTRSGSCAWDPSDSGYHEVCVTMSDTFLEQSARHDANDLRSVCLLYTSPSPRDS